MGRKFQKHKRPRALGSIKLVPDWKKCTKWLSIRFSAAGIVANGLWLLLPGLQQNISSDLITKITLGLFMLIAIGRMVDQNKE